MKNAEEREIVTSGVSAERHDTKTIGRGFWPDHRSRRADGQQDGTEQDMAALVAN